MKTFLLLSIAVTALCGYARSDLENSKWRISEAHRILFFIFCIEKSSARSSIIDNPKHASD